MPQTDDAWDGVAYQADFGTTAAAAAAAAGSAAGSAAAAAGAASSAASSATADGQWQAINLPFSSFLPSLRGRVVAGAPPLSGDKVRQVGLMVSKFAADGGATPGFRAGAFRLEVKALRGLRGGD